MLFAVGHGFLGTIVQRHQAEIVGFAIIGLCEEGVGDGPLSPVTAFDACALPAYSRTLQFLVQNSSVAHLEAERFSWIPVPGGTRHARGSRDWPPGFCSELYPLEQGPRCGFSQYPGVAGWTRLGMVRSAPRLPDVWACPGPSSARGVGVGPTRRKYE